MENWTGHELSRGPALIRPGTLSEAERYRRFLAALPPDTDHAPERVYSVDEYLGPYAAALYGMVEMRRRYLAARTGDEIRRTNDDYNQAAFHLATWIMTGSPAADAYANAGQQ